MKSVATLALAFTLSVGSFAQGSVLLTNTSHTGGTPTNSDSGLWNNNAQGNWAIWYAAGNTTAAVTVPAFVNDSGAIPPLGTAISLPMGSSRFTLYKADNGSTIDEQDVFSFAVGSHTGTITLNPATNYLSTNTSPTLTGGPITLGGETIAITGFDWYAPGVFNQSFVGQGQNLTPNGINDVALLTITVTPEPSSIVLCALGAAGLFVAIRRRKTYCGKT